MVHSLVSASLVHQVAPGRVHVYLGRVLNLEKLLRAKRWSDRRAGAETLSSWRKLERRPSYPTAATIGAKLGLLKKGDATWWRNQVHALGALAALVGCRPEELLPTGQAEIGAIEFGQFPELTPLLPGQDPCSVRSDVGWLGAFADAALHQGVHAWIVAPAGAGKSLAIRVLQQRHGSRIVATSVRRLFDAARHARDNLPLLVEVGAMDPGTDAGALAELTKRTTNVCVMAPFSRAVMGGIDERWAEARWHADLDWRERIARWAQARLPKPDDIDVEETLAWLSVIDPLGRLFSTPGHVLPLLARAYRAGLPRGPHALHDLGCEVLAQTLGGDLHPWLRHLGVAAIEQMIVARLNRLDFPMTALPVGAWAELLPAKLIPTACDNREAKPSVVKKGTKAELRPAQELTAPPPTQAVHLLVDAGVLQTEDAGGYDVAPWIRVGIEREAITQAIKTGNVNWALWAVEDTRKEAVDDALNALSPADLLGATRKALAADLKALPTVAAIEALFSAIGRRMIDKGWAPSPEMQPVLQELGLRQLRLLAAVPAVGTVLPFLPLTRNRPGFDRAWPAEWLAEAWTFSFSIERPPTVEPEPGWALPGWNRKLSLSDAPRDLPWPRASGTTSEARAIDRLLSIARRSVRACQDQSLPKEVHGLLLPWVVIDGPARGWKLDPHHGKHLLYNAPAGLVGELLRGEPSEVCVSASQTVWQAALAQTGGDAFTALNHLGQVAPSLRTLVESSLPPNAFAEAISLTSLEPSDFGHGLSQVPPRLLRPTLAVIARYVRQTGRPINEVAPVVERLGSDDLDLLVEFVADKYNVGVVAARRVWQLDPDRAIDEAREALGRGTTSESYAWFHSSPRARCAALLDELMRVPAPSWSARWLTEVLPLAGSEAPRVFAMMGLRHTNVVNG